jgi:hypothetical protein
MTEAGIEVPRRRQVRWRRDEATTTPHTRFGLDEGMEAMNHRLRVALVASLGAVVMLSLGFVGTPRAADDGPRLTGSWFGTATATSVPLPPLKDLITFTSDGNVIEAHRQRHQPRPSRSTRRRKKRSPR